MRTNIELDETLVAEAFKYSDAKTKKALVDEALRELIKHRSREDIRDLVGKVKIRDDYDYKRLRTGDAE